MKITSSQIEKKRNRHYRVIFNIYEYIIRVLVT
jgi:hypothetical protein